jgi:hypothetical protein
MSRPQPRPRSGNDVRRVTRGTTYVGRTAIQSRALAMVTEGRARWSEHHMQVHGVCDRCGHTYPCEDALQAAWLIVYWEPYLPEPGLVRPYVVAEWDPGDLP